MANIANLKAYLISVIPSGVIAIDDGGSFSYHKYINATCTEKVLMDKFSGWEFDTSKPVDELQVNYIVVYESMNVWHSFFRSPVFKTLTVTSSMEWTPSQCLMIQWSSPCTSTCWGSLRPCLVPWRLGRPLQFSAKTLVSQI